MGNQPQAGNRQFRPKKVSKTQVEIACLKVKAHLELVKDRKSNEVMKAEKAMVALVSGHSRNKTEELLQAEKIINDLKYIQACSTLIAYANTLRNYAGMIAESEGQAARLQELMMYIYSIMYASKFLGLFSLNEFRELMMSFFGTDAVPVTIDLVDPKIEQAFRVKPSPYEVNTYFLEMGNRNKISLEKINEIHQFSNNPVFTDPQTNPTIPVNPAVNPNPFQNNPNPYQNNPNPYQNNPNPYQNNPYPSNANPYQTGIKNPNQGYPQQSAINDPFAPNNNVPIGPGSNQQSRNNGMNQQQQAQEFFVPPSNPPPVVNPISRPPLVQPPPSFSNLNNGNLNDINNIDDIPLYPEMDMDFKNMGPPGGMRATNNFVPPPPMAVTPSVVSPALPPMSVAKPVPVPVPEPLPVVMVENPFPEPSNEFFIPPPQFSKAQFNPTNPTTLVDSNFEQICEEIRRGL
jgi:hypothetical protein